ncbi:VOC family protein [Nesterenkonia haasae]|uniref:VOC family protein n=1 Tax=Nesterenkonia haasae TaxID=2587813 RepID=UPI0013917570|nr:VOC family protein [Nesterenkonia haasae]NDK32161.1 VOC family protein [Nesterenkonia haasae]
MSITTTTHLNFRGTARQALEFYQTVFGGVVATMTYGDFGMPAEAADASKVVFGRLESDNGFRIMAFDVPGGGSADNRPQAGMTRREHGMTFTDQTFFQSLQAQSLDELSAYWEALAEGGEVIEPLAASPWSAGFGMVTDRFGVTWVLDVQSEED